MVDRLSIELSKDGLQGLPALQRAARINSCRDTQRVHAAEEIGPALRSLGKLPLGAGTRNRTVPVSLEGCLAPWPYPHICAGYAFRRMPDDRPISAGAGCADFIWWQVLISCLLWLI